MERLDDQIFHDVFTPLWRVVAVGKSADDAGDHADCMALSEGALKQISECDGPSQLEQRLRVVKVFHLVGVLGEQFSGVDRLGNVAQKPPKRLESFPNVV